MIMTKTYQFTTNRFVEDAACRNATTHKRWN